MDKRTQNGEVAAPLSEHGTGQGDASAAAVTQQQSQSQSEAPAEIAAGFQEKPDVHAMIRVDQAGEYGAKQIYAGQLAVMGDDAPDSAMIRHMAEQEQRHLDAFNQLIVERGVRPTLLQPIWKVAGYALGAGTALMGPRAAMACTAAVETEIDRHYQQQRDALAKSDEDELEQTIAQFQAEELEHKQIAMESGAREAPAYPVLTGAIRLGCRLAIGIAKRV